MKYHAMISFVLLGLLPALAMGQGRLPPRSNPAISPYLNLLRPENPPAINYYGLVKPQTEFRNNINQLDQRVTNEQQQLTQQDQQGASTLPPTGHAVGFQTQSRYFMTLKGPGGQGASFTSGRPPTNAARSQPAGGGQRPGR